jgi:putative membrane protein
MMHLYNYGNYGPGYAIGFGFLGVLGALLHLIFWLIIIAIIFRFFRRRGMAGRRHMWMQSSALDILKERYAKGEINKTEFEEKKKDLE